MLWWGPTLVLVAAAAALLVPRRATGSPGYDPPPEAPGGRRALDELLDRAGLSPDAKAFLRAVARRESAFNPQARNERPREVKSGRDLFESMLRQGYFEGNPYHQQFREFGSGGLFGELAGTALKAGGKKGPFQRSSPYVLWQPAIALATYLDFLNRLMGYKSFKNRPTWGTLRLGGKGLSVMGNPDGATAQKVLGRLDEDLRATGGDPALASRRVDDWFYSGIRSTLATLGGEA